MRARTLSRMAWLGAAWLGLGAAWLGLGAGPGCSPGVSTLPSEAGGEIMGIAVSPGNEVLQIDLNQRKSRSFSALGILPDGSTVDVSERVRWSLDDPFVGELTSPEAGSGTGATFLSAARSSAQVGFARINAKLGDSSQLTGYGQLTLVWLRQSGPAQDFFFQLPYSQTATPEMRPLSLSTYVQSLDAFLAVDTTGSMGPSINELTSSLSRTIIPGIQAAAIKDAWFGVGAVEDFPAVPFGEASCYKDGTADDQPFMLLSPMDASTTKAGNAVKLLMRPSSMFGNIPRGCGGDIPEAQIEALYQIATGAGLMAGATIPPYKGTGRGGAGFRDGALPVITLITDASFHVKGETNRICPAVNPNGTPRSDSTAYSGPIANAAHSRGETLTALAGVCAKVIGVAPQLSAAEECLANRDLIDTARATGALVPPEAWDSGSGRPAGCGAGLCCTGPSGAGEAPGPDGQCPLVFKVSASGQGLGAQVVQGITDATRET